MRVSRLLILAAGLALQAAPAAAAPASGPPVTTAGTSFLTATPLAPGQDASVGASTGDYLYWGFAASEGQTDTVRVTVTLPPSSDRHGPQTWSVDVFDGLRRRQACTAGPQQASADASAPALSLSCTLRQIRSWAEPWSGDPLPGTYYIRLTAGAAPQQDLGLAAQVQLHISAQGGPDNAQPEGGALRAPLVPPVNGGSTAVPGTAPSASASASASASPEPGTVGVAAPAQQKPHWYSWLLGWNSRWYWTLAGGTLAALAGATGYQLSRHPRGQRFGAVHRQARRPEYAER